ncbi:MAG: 3-hydroxyacyl-CoA dehydrogenase family protein [Deltaproteobacteria bacterium]|nr:3-hydroxyacyl-CoA dehydrogenase family protein [Deltaproteobacteria bacterium]
MKLGDIKNITVLGSGIMGHGIAQSFLMGGYKVMLFDISDAILATAKAHVKKNLELFFKSGLIPETDIEASLQRLSTTTDLEKAVSGADFIIEAAPEDINLKQDLFEKIESFAKENAIIASNTSSLTLQAIGERVKNKSRLVVTHWFNPPHIVPTVEVVKNEDTSDETVAVAYELMEKIKKSPVKINWEIPGFIVNRIQIAMVREVLNLYQKGVASAADIDRAVKGSMGFRLASIGPLLTIDLGGVKLWRSVCANLLPNIESGTEVPAALENLVAEGHDGIKSGKGFYDYTNDFSKEDLDKAIEQRDQEFLNRLKNLYFEK